MQRAGVKGIHIAERDTQRARDPKPRGKFVNTWSVEGFVAEGLQPAELGWGTHEKALPPGGAPARVRLRRGDLPHAARAPARACARGRRRAQAQHGFLVTHNESISIADYFTLREGGKVVYRPTCHYAYHPCDDAVLSLHEMAGAPGSRSRRGTSSTEDDIVDGIDELGVLLYGHAKNAYWYGSQLSIEETRRLAPYQNATGLQVTSAVLAGIVWMLENPERGIVEADEMDFRRCLEIQRPYLGPVVGHYTDWTPLAGRGGLFPEDVDHERSVAVQERAGRLIAHCEQIGDGERRRALPPFATDCPKVGATLVELSPHRASRGKKSLTLSPIRLFVDCPISHVPVAVCRSVGIRTRGRTAA